MAGPLYVTLGGIPKPSDDLLVDYKNYVVEILSTGEDISFKPLDRGVDGEGYNIVSNNTFNHTIVYIMVAIAVSAGSAMIYRVFRRKA